VQDYDKSSKWLIQHHGDSILRLAGVDDLVSWRPLQAEVVQPRQLPDGLLEGRRAGRDEPDLFILELATYPEQRLLEQVLRDMTLVYLDRRVLPEVLALILHPKGNLRAADALDRHSPRGWTHWQVRWRVVELWTIPAEALLAADDVGLIPWVPQSAIAGPPEPVLQQCRERIDRLAPPDERDNLLAVSQVLAHLRYNDPKLLGLFGGRDAMPQFPLIQEIVAERMHKDLLKFLTARFGPVPQDVATALRAVGDESQLDDLVELAAVCPDLETFRARLQP
jgi:hypothetical protein